MEELIWKNNFDEGEVKKAINTLIWTYGHPLMNLQEADKLADDFHNNFFMSCKRVENHRGGITKSDNA